MHAVLLVMTDEWEEAERTWMPHGLCRTGKLPKQAWQCGESGTMVVSGREVNCYEVTKLAVMICQTCPVQWSCTRFALDTEAAWGTYGCRIRYLKWMLEDLEYWDALLIIDDAELAGTPVEIAMRDAKKARRTTGGRVASAA